MDQIFELLKQLKLNDIINFSKEVITFFTKPVKFFKIFINKDRVTQAYQLGYYFLISSGFCLILLDISLKSLFKFYLENTVEYTLLQSLVLSVSLLLTSKFYKLNYPIEDIFSRVLVFLLCLDILTTPIALYFDNLYEDSQKYEYYILNSLVSSFVLIIELIYSGSIFLTKTKHIIFYTISLFILLNVGNLVDPYISFDEYTSKESTIYSDSPFDEFKVLERKFSDFEERPILKVVVLSKDWNHRFFIFSDELETIRKTLLLNNKDVIDRSDAFIKKVQEKYDYTKRVANKIEFDRNKIYLNKCQSYYKSIIDEINVPIDTSRIFAMYSYRVNNNNNNNIRTIYSYIVNNKIHTNKMDIISFAGNYYSAKLNALEVDGFIYTLYFYPSIYINEKLINK